MEGHVRPDVHCGHLKVYKQNHTICWIHLHGPNVTGEPPLSDALPGREESKGQRNTRRTSGACC